MPFAITVVSTFSGTIKLKRVSRDQIRVNVGEAAFVSKKLVEALMT